MTVEQLEQLKQTISARTGIPVAILQGETEEDTLSFAKTLLAFRQQHGEDQPKSTGEQFSDYLHDIGFIQGEKEKDSAQVLSDLEAELHPPYPNVHDAGENVSIDSDAKRYKDEMYNEIFWKYVNKIDAWS